MDLFALREQLIKELRAESDKMAALSAKFVADSGTDHDQQDFDAAEKKAAELTGKIQKIDATIAAGAGITAAPAAPPAAAAGTYLTASKIEAIEPPKKFNSLGQMLKSVILTAVNKGFHDPRLDALDTTGGINAAFPSGNNEAFGAEGGFMIPTEFATGIFQLNRNEGSIFNKVLKIPMLTNSISLPGLAETGLASGARLGGVVSQWVGSGETFTTSGVKSEPCNLNLKKLVIAVTATEELIQDSPAMGVFTDNSARREMYTVLDSVVVGGNGANQPLGFLKSPGLLTIAKESGQTNGTIVALNLLKMKAAYCGGENAMWIAHKDAVAQLATLNLANQPIFLPGGTITGKLTDQLLGYPLIYSDHCQAVGTPGDIMLVDPMFYFMGMKRNGAGDGPNIQNDVSIHVNFLQAQSVFRFILRVDGQPALKKPLDPINGTTKQSTHLVIAQR
jgi:HK97 family phage major capsid protein